MATEEQINAALAVLRAARVVVFHLATERDKACTRRGAVPSAVAAFNSQIATARANVQAARAAVLALLAEP